VTLIQFANAFAIAITFARWRRRSEATATVPYGTHFIIFLNHNFFPTLWLSVASTVVAETSAVKIGEGIGKIGDL